MKYDLHSHTTASDGVLTSRELLLRAKNRAVDVLAITDHDTVEGLEEARHHANEIGITLVNGVEVSVTWNKTQIHIVGLGVDYGNEELLEKTALLQKTRILRAEKIAQHLEKEGFDKPLEGALRYSANENITRTHFARYIINTGRARDMAEVFKHYLSYGKPGYVSAQWLSLEDAVGMLNRSGGQAVIAHPSRYKMTNTKMRKLLADFKSAGGAGMEVVNSGLNPEIIKHNASLAMEFDLLASAGSDFHSPDNKYIDLGRFPELPQTVTPVWQEWKLQ